MRLRCVAIMSTFTLGELYTKTFRDDDDEVMVINDEENWVTFSIEDLFSYFEQE